MLRSETRDISPSDKESRNRGCPALNQATLHSLLFGLVGASDIYDFLAALALASLTTTRIPHPARTGREDIHGNIDTGNRPKSRRGGWERTLYTLLTYSTTNITTQRHPQLNHTL